jgi:O-Antigen ligase
MTAALTDRLLWARRRIDHTSGLQWLVTLVLIGAVGLVAAHSIAGMSGHVPKPLLAVLVLAGASILLALETEHLFLGWLFLAPLFQESASNNRLGHLIALGVYTAPPLLFGVKALATRGPRPRRRWFDFLPAIYVGFLLVSLVTTASSELTSGTVGTLRTFYQNVAIGVIVYYVVAFWRGRPLPTVRITGLVLAAAAIQAAMASIEWQTGWNLWHNTNWVLPGDVRAIATLGNPAVTGAFIGVGMVVALAVLAWHGPLTLRRLAIVMLVVGVPGLYATKTRGPILATVVVSALCLLLSSRSRLLGIGLSTLVALTLFALWPQIKASQVYQNRFSEQQNVQARLLLQTVSIRLAEKRPIFGWGYNSFDRVKFTVPVASNSIPLEQALQSTSHSTLLTILVEFGLVGLALFALPWVSILWRAFRRARAPSERQWFLVAATASILVIAIDGATLDYRYFSFIPMVAWLFLGLVRREIDSDTLSAAAS